MTKTQHHHESSLSSSSGKRFKTYDTSGVASWSDVNHDVLFLVMMQLGFVDFFAFSGVCKSWRLFELSNMNTFMTSKPPMSVCISIEANEDYYYYLEDFERREFKHILPHFTDMLCVGSTCGYLVLFGVKNCEFWPITRHEIHFPDFRLHVDVGREKIRTILVFSPSHNGWVFVLLYKRKLFYRADKQRWNRVASTGPIVDLHVFKGKIYTLHTDCSLCELRLNLKQKRESALFETKIFLKPDLLKPELVSSDDKLYLVDRIAQPEKVMELDFGEMKWVSPEKTIGDYAFLISVLNPSAAIKPESWTGLQTQYKSYNNLHDTDKIRQHIFNYRRVWYFLHDCSNVNLLDE